VQSTIEEVVARLWPGAPARVERLSAGITNANFRVDVHDETFVVRLVGARTELLGIDRRSEVAAGRLAAALGIGPEILEADVEGGVMVTRFIEARSITAGEIGAEPILREITTALWRVHRSGKIDSTFDTFRLVPAYREIGRQHGVDPPFDYDLMQRTLERVAAARPWRPAALCHNDLLNSNLLHEGSGGSDDTGSDATGSDDTGSDDTGSAGTREAPETGIRIVDWEYAGMGDPYFDLGNLSVNHGFAPESDLALLRHYFGEADEPELATLELFKLASEAREAMWGVVQMAISTLEVDFEEYASEHGAGYFRVLDRIDIDRCLELAATVPP
jgi:thiamine kinase-like enzyme